MPLESGLGAQWCALDEVTYGVAPALTAAPFFVWDSDTLDLVKGTKQSVGIYSQARFPNASRRVAETYAVQGALTGDLAQRGLNAWLYRMFGSYGQTKAALTQDGTTGAYLAVHAPGAPDGHSFTVQKGAPGVDGVTVPMTFTGCKISDWTISCAMSDIAKLQLTVEGRNRLAGTWKDPLNASVPSLVPFTAPPGGVFHWVGAQLITGGTATTSSGVTTVTGGAVAGNVKGPLNIKVTTPLDGARYAPTVAPFRNEPVQSGIGSVTGQFTVEWLSTSTYLAAHDNDTPTAVALNFTGPAIGTGSDFSTLQLLVPNIRIDTAPVPIPGPAVLDQAVSWTALDDRVNNVVQATYYTLDTA